MSSRAPGRARRPAPFPLLFPALLLVLLPAAEAARPRARLWPDLGRPPARAPGGGAPDAAVLVGIERYLTVPRVPGAVDNLKDWYGWLIKGRRVPASRISLLENLRGTREKILREVTRRAGQVEPGGKLWFVFIGHGAPSRDGRDGILVGADAQQDADSLYARSVSRREVLRAAAGGRQAHTVMVLDACFSGRGRGGRALVKGLQPLIATGPLATPDRRAVVLTAGRGDEFAGPLPGLGRPAFSYLALGGLRGWADRDHDGEVTGTEVVGFAREALGTVLVGRSQTPEVAGAARAELARGAEPHPDLVAIRLKLVGTPARAGPAVPTVAEGVIRTGDGGWDPTARARPRAVVRFVSTPPGAIVTIDGVGRCKSTPCSVEVEEGPATVAMSLEDYRPRAAEVELRNGAEVRWTLKPNFTELSVRTEPAGLAVTLDGRALGRTPVAARRIPPGPHVVMVQDRCYLPVGQRILARAGHPRTLTLRPEPRPSGLDVRALDGRGQPLVASVYVDGRRVGRTPGVFKVGVCAKKVEVRHPKLGSWSGELRLREKRVSAVVARLRGQRDAPSTGRGRAGIAWVRLPGGTFSMGSEDGDSDEKPVHRVTLSAFELARTEVTVAQYRACVEAGACTPPLCALPWNWNWGKPGRDDHPVNCVDWNQARAFSRWVGGRLPTEAEWEYAARSGGRPWRYPWGNEKASCSRAVMDDGETTATAGSETAGCGVDGTWPVCSKPAGNTRQGLCDMAGNVWEWVADWYGKYSSGAARNPTGPASGSFRVRRGGGWGCAARGCRAANRAAFGPGSRLVVLGFRPARSVP